MAEVERPLRALVDRLRASGRLRALHGPIERIDFLNVDHLAQDSRKVGPGGLFVAIPGAAVDGHMFIEKTVENGANAIVCETVPDALLRQPSGTVHRPSLTPVLIEVDDSRAALAELATAFYGDPSHRLALVGVTGTNGKTTTSFLIHHALTRLGRTTGLMGTIEYRIGEDAVEAPLTTPDALTLNVWLARMAEAGCTACVMEVSSHALDQERVHGQRFAAGIFTNLTHDHLDYHGSFDAYLGAKKRLFDMLPAEATALYSIDDPAGPRIVRDTAARAVSYGRDARADLHLQILADRIDGLQLKIDGHVRRFRLVGAFNAYNLTAAYGAGLALGYPADAVLDALADAPPVPGRFERLGFASGVTVVVDYAHTPDALDNVLQTARATQTEAGRLWCLFGCGGDRDPAKRPVMGRIAERYADEVVVTSDNPRTENPQAILADIRPGLDAPERARWIVDRREAIRYAAAHAAPGDVVVIAGKGHEPYQIIGTEKRHFDDREEARTAFGPELDPDAEPTAQR